MRTSKLVPLLLLAVAGCPDREVSKIDPVQHPETVTRVDVGVTRDVDILFVIDNSGSMAEEQASLTSNFYQFMNVLENIEGGLPNVHIGVVSSNVGVGGYNITSCAGEGDDGRLQNVATAPGCTPPSGYYISDVANPDGSRTKNYTGTLADTFACIARLGQDGCGFEQHFEAMRRALDGSNPQNAGFLRANAFLAVIFVADEDDCSAEDSQIFDPSQTMVSDPLGPLSSFRCAEFGIECDEGTLGRAAGTYTNCRPRDPPEYIAHPDEYIQFLKGLKGGGDDLIYVAAIVGNPEPVVVGTETNGNPALDPSCVTGAGEAFPGVRFRYFLDAFAEHATFTSICNTDLAPALVEIANALAVVAFSPCLVGDIDDADLDPDRTGLQLDCAVADVRNFEESDQESFPIRRCEMQDDRTPAANQTLPCWYAYKDPTTCDMTPTQLVLKIERAGDPPLGTKVIARCTANVSQ